MNLKRQRTIIFALGLLSFIGFVTMAILVNGNQIIQFDTATISIVQGWESPEVTGMMKFFTFVGSGKSVGFLAVVAIIFFYFVLKHRMEIILFIAVILGSSLLNNILKHIFHRARPELHRLIEIGEYSFPSGHAMNAVTFFGILTFILWKHIPGHFGRGILLTVCGGLILLIGISRIYLGVHYPSDVIGGIFASVFWLSIVIWMYLRIKRK